MIQDVAGEKALTVRLAPDVYQRLDELARREKRSVSAQAAYLIERALGRQIDEATLIREIETGITAISREYPEAKDDIHIELGQVQLDALRRRDDVQQGYLELVEPFQFPSRAGRTGAGVSFTRTSRRRFPIAVVGVPDHMRVVGAGPWEREQESDRKS